MRDQMSLFERVTNATTPIAEPKILRFADEEMDSWLADYGVPYETRDESGQRLCRHHRQPIRSRAYPCAECRRG